MPEKIKAAIIFFDEIHIIPHFTGPAKALYEDPDFELDILTYKGTHDFLYQSLKAQNLPKTLIKQLPTYLYRQLIEKLKKRRIPSPLYLFKKHKDKLLNNYDVLIFNDINHEYLHQYKTGHKPKFVLLMHGAGDRDYLIGEAYKDSVSKFDLIATSGEKVTAFFRKMQLKNTVLKICGYQKFDVINENNQQTFFDNDNPVILYNPHFEKGISSWYDFGEQILEFFYEHKDYNLIFAPHINLFNKKGYLKPGSIPQKYFNAGNIHIDLNSPHLVNMDYTLAADMYLGDVSSQIYEFLYKPRPAVFINTHQTKWQDDPHYTHWQLGKVINDIQPLKTLIDTRKQWHQEYLGKQKELFEYTFLKTGKGEASQNIKNAIKNLIIAPEHKD